MSMEKRLRKLERCAPEPVDQLLDLECLNLTEVVIA